MTFSYRPAVRDRVALLVAIAGASGSGKTLSALKIARGLVGGDDGKIAVIDTEAGRAKHYAPGPGEAPGPDRFAFQHGDLTPPFSPEGYVAAIEAAEEAGAEVVVIDSFSHEWEGEGGLHDIHDADLARAVERARESHNANWGPFDEARAAERANIGAWRDAKARHKRLINRLLQCRAHLVICLRADEKVRIVKEGNKTKIVQASDLPPAERWSPICEKRFMYEMTVSLIVAPQAPGVPVPIKIQEQHRHAFPEGRRLSEETGQLLAEWSRGGRTASPPPDADRGAGGPPAASPPSAAEEAGPSPNPEALADYERYVRMVVDEDGDAATLAAWWNSDAQKAERARTGVAKDDARMVALRETVVREIERRKQRETEAAE